MTVGDLDTREHRVARIAQEIGLNFQNPNDQLFHNTVDEEIRYGPKNFEYNDERIDELVEDAVERQNSRTFGRKPVRHGQPKRKRVAVASVIAMDTPIVVLDEPTGGQDAEGNELLGDLVESLVSDGVLVVVITHDVDFASRYADRLIAPLTARSSTARRGRCSDNRTYSRRPTYRRRSLRRSDSNSDSRRRC